MGSRRITPEYLALVAYVETNRAPGYLLDFRVIEQETGVPMDSRGKQMLRRAIMRTKLEYLAKRNIGCQLADSDTVMEILGHRVMAIDSRVIRADTSERLLQEQFFHSLSVEEQKGILFLGSVFGAIRLAAEQAKQIWGPERKELPSGNPIVPDRL